MNRRIIFSILTLLGVCITATVIILGIIFYTALTSNTPIFPVLEDDSAQAIYSTTIITVHPLDTPIPAQDSINQQLTPDGPARPTPIPLPPALAAQMDTIQQQVIALRGLQTNKPVIRALLSPTDLKKKVETDFFKDYSDQDAMNDQAVLHEFGLLPKSFDLRKFYFDLYNEQIAGFYDNETKEMFVVQGADFGGIERMTYAHEFTHTLQDQNYDLKQGMKLDDSYCKTETEYCSAATALVEGDASFTESRWLFGSASDQDKNDIQSFYTGYSSPVYNSAPQYMQKDFIFPYMQGMEFVNSLFDRGGYAAINNAFRDPPVTTEQILHPDKYPSEKPALVNLPDMIHPLGEGWKLAGSNVLGEWYTSLVLSFGNEPKTRLPEMTGRTAAAGWGGDRYAVYTRNTDGAVVLILHSRWDSEQDAAEFFKALHQYAGLDWGSPSREDNKQYDWDQSPDGEVMIQQHGEDTLWLITPDLSIQQKIIKNMPEFQVQP